MGEKIFQSFLFRCSNLDHSWPEGADDDHSPQVHTAA